jgi:hypothetical protein
LKINRFHFGEAEFALIQTPPAVAQIEKAIRDTRMQTYRAVSQGNDAAGDALNLAFDKGSQEHLPA